MMHPLRILLQDALHRRKDLRARLQSEGTDCLRLFHGTVEGEPGLTVDAYGPLILAQTFRRSFAPEEILDLASWMHELWDAPCTWAFKDRTSRGPKAPSMAGEEDPVEVIVTELGARYWIRARHRGLDPWLFLDLRAGRRVLRTEAAGRSVLNLFAYTCSAGVLAALAGAAEVWNVDFAGSSLEVGRRNAELNQVSQRMKFLQEDCLAVLRQCAGLPVQRRSLRLRFTVLQRRQFDVVMLDPPPLAKGPFGTVDVVNDYPSLFKPAWLSVADGGLLLATNNSAKVTAETFLEVLQRCAAKAGRPIRELQRIPVDPDFPSSDGQSPLKIVLCRP